MFIANDSSPGPRAASEVGVFVEELLFCRERPAQILPLTSVQGLTGSLDATWTQVISLP